MQCIILKSSVLIPFLKHLFLFHSFNEFLKGDSGGPLIIRGKSVSGTINPRQCQAGITSFIAGLGCQKGYPAGFSRVAYFLDDFITKETGVLACNECSDSTVPYLNYSRRHSLFISSSE